MPAPAPGSLVAHPALGWCLLGAGGLIVIGSFMDWATALGGLVSASGIDGGDGWFTVVLGLAVAGLGLVIGLRAGGVAASIVAGVLGIATVLLAIYEISNVDEGRAVGVSVGTGLWLITLAGLVAAGLGFAGLGIRVAQ